MRKESFLLSSLERIYDSFVCSDVKTQSEFGTLLLVHARKKRQFNVLAFLTLIYPIYLRKTYRISFTALVRLCSITYWNGAKPFTVVFLNKFAFESDFNGRFRCIKTLRFTSSLRCLRCYYLELFWTLPLFVPGRL